MAKSPNPRGRLKGALSLMRDQHKRFLATCHANSYTCPETIKMIEKEFGLVVTKSAVQYYFNMIRNFGPILQEKFKGRTEFDEKEVSDFMITYKPGITRHAGMMTEWLSEKYEVANDPAYGIAYADKRRRTMKLSQNIVELDEPKVFARGSYPTSRDADGSMTFKEFEIANKEHGEQRKHLEAIGDMMEGVASGDVIINIVDRSPSEEGTTEFAQKKAKKVAAARENEDIGLPSDHNPQEVDVAE